MEYKIPIRQDRLNFNCKNQLCKFQGHGAMPMHKVQKGSDKINLILYAPDKNSVTNLAVMRR